MDYGVTDLCAALRLNLDSLGSQNQLIFVLNIRHSMQSLQKLAKFAHHRVASLKHTRRK